LRFILSPRYCGGISARGLRGLFLRAGECEAVIYGGGEFSGNSAFLFVFLRWHPGQLAQGGEGRPGRRRIRTRRRIATVAADAMIRYVMSSCHMIFLEIDDQISHLIDGESDAPGQKAGVDDDKQPPFP
jgi:hypothetical protein